MPTVIPFAFYQEERRRLEEERRRSEEEITKFYERLIKEKEEKGEVIKENGEEITTFYERLIKVKEEVIKVKEEVIKVKEEVIKVKEQLLDEKNLAYNKLQTETLARESEIRGIATMRPFIELGCCNYTNNKNSTFSVQEFVKKELHDTEWLNARLTELEGNSLMLPVVKKELSDLYHELSKQIHHPELQNMKGFVCGGAKPLRLATALALLKLQELNFLSYEITYADESYKPLKSLRGGKVINL